VVIFHKPTRGFDVAAIAEIHQIINGLAGASLTLVGISSHLPEILNLSDRIMVYRRGRFAEELSPSQANEEKIMYAAVH
jgi:simple sugar transport system ATP-binding protein